MSQSTYKSKKHELCNDIVNLVKTKLPLAKGACGQGGQWPYFTSIYDNQYRAWVGQKKTKPVLNCDSSDR